jgi:hypothetical protein
MKVTVRRPNKLLVDVTGDDGSNKLVFDGKTLHHLLGSGQKIRERGIIGSEHVHMAYNASKAAVRLMTKSVVVQHAKDKIRANSVHPGIMPPMRTSGRTADPAVRAERMRVIPMRRPGEVDEVAYATCSWLPTSRLISQARKSTWTAELSPYSRYREATLVVEWRDAVLALSRLAGTLPKLTGFCRKAPRVVHSSPGGTEGSNPSSSSGESSELATANSFGWPNGEGS